MNTLDVLNDIDNAVILDGTAVILDAKRAGKISSTITANTVIGITNAKRGDNFEIHCIQWWVWWYTITLPNIGVFVLAPAVWAKTTIIVHYDGSTFTLAGNSNNTSTILLDEDNMISDSNTEGATQQSIKAYVDLLVSGALIPQWLRNANTNTPALISSVGGLWYLYVVSVSGTTTLDWSNDWFVWDVLFFANGVWNRVPNTVSLTWGTITWLLSDQTDLQLALDNKADLIHTHIISQITWLQSALDGKAPTIHTHTIAQVVDLTTELNSKVNVLTPTVVLTEITFLVDRIHGLYLTPITGDITASTTAGVAWVVCHVFHNQGTEPTITGATKLSGEYVISTLNLIQFMFDGTTVFYTITPNA